MKLWRGVVVPWTNRWLWIPFLITLVVLGLGGLEGYRRLNNNGWTIDLITGHQRNAQQFNKERTALTEAENEALRREVIRLRQNNPQGTTTNTNSSVVVVGGGTSVTVTSGSEPAVVQTGSDTVRISNGNYRCDCQREHFAHVTLMNGDYIGGCNAPSDQTFPPSAVREVTLMNGDYICPCEQNHGAGITLMNGSSNCQ